jgi:secreted Zn-dependent insulinase-like peptidase
MLAPCVLHRQQYSAERMCLAVLGGHSLDTLQQWVGAAFAGVPAGRGPRPEFAAAGPPFEVLPAANDKRKDCVIIRHC